MGGRSAAYEESGAPASGALLTGRVLAENRRLDARFEVAAAASVTGRTNPSKSSSVTSPRPRRRAAPAAASLALAAGKHLALPKGAFHLREVNLPGFMRLSGIPGATHLIGSGDAPIARVGAISDLIIDGIGFIGNLGSGEDAGLLTLDGAENVTIINCKFTGRATGIVARGSRATIENCLFNDMGDAAIHSANSLGMQIRGNRINLCGNAGVRIWRDESGIDGSIVTGNQISSIDWVDGGNGQNGNGVNVFQADGVVVSDNVFVDCSFTAVRVNAGRNTQVRGNTCYQLGRGRDLFRVRLLGLGDRRQHHRWRSDRHRHHQSRHRRLPRDLHRQHRAQHHAEIGGEPGHAAGRHLCRGRYGWSPTM